MHLIKLNILIFLHVYTYLWYCLYLWCRAYTWRKKKKNDKGKEDEPSHLHTVPSWPVEGHNRAAPNMLSAQVYFSDHPVTTLPLHTRP